MKAYRNGITKTAFVAEMKKHQEADRFIQGTYWENGRGCANGCAVESINKLLNKDSYHNNYRAVSEALGWPLWFCMLEDTIFEKLPINRSKSWPAEVAEAVQEGVDLNQCLNPILIKFFELAKEAILEKTDSYYKRSVDATNRVIKALKTGESIPEVLAAADDDADVAAAFAAYAAYAVGVAAANVAAAYSGYSARTAAMERIADEVLQILRQAK